MAEGTSREVRVVTSLETGEASWPGDSVKCVVLSADVNLSDSQTPSTALLLLKPIDDEVFIRLVVWNRAQFEALKACSVRNSCGL